jgi:hypothetical protein
MTFNVDSKKLFDGLAEAVARVVREDGSGTPILKLDSTRPCVYEVVGNAAAKTDVPMLEVEVDDGLNVRLELEDARRVILMQKEWLKKEASRTEMYKQKYEDSEAQLEEERLDREDERLAWDEERKRLEKKIIQLEAQLVWEKENPRNQTIGVQINNTTSKVHSEMKVDEIKVEEMKVDEMKVEEGTGISRVVVPQGVENKDVEDIGICRFIVWDKIINNTHYGKTDEERIDQYNRIIYRASHKKLSTFVKFLKDENEKGYLKFDTQDLEEIYNHLVECYGDLHGNLRSFKDACHGATDGKKTGFYWNPK